MVDIKKLKELSKKFTVLYVEDDEAIRNFTVTYLEKIFLSVTTAMNGVDGLEKYKTEKFNIVITDLSMPKMNGLGMIAKIKEIDENQAVLITTAHADSDNILNAIRLGVDGYIIKPFEYEQLNIELYKIVEKLNIFAQNEQYKKNLKQMVEKKTLEITQMMLFKNDNYEKTLLSMVEMIEDRDTYTAGHSKRVAQYCKIIAVQMGHSEEECTRLYQAAILHDVGKIATPDAVLLNPKSLNEIEYTLIKEHVEVGFKLLDHIPMFESLADVVHSHHERYDGRGYPRGLSGDEIHPLARVMIVADAFDAMTTNRIYKTRKSVQEALDELVRFKLQQFHPEVVDSALIALRDVKIDETINQIPQTKLEQERFAYFYKDRLADTYNQNYLEIILKKNSYEKEFSHIDVLLLNNFSQYNKEVGWNRGDEFLHTLGAFLSNYFKESLVFRVFGDDFAILSKKEMELSDLKMKLDTMMSESCLDYMLKSIQIEADNFHAVSQLEELIN